MTRHCARPGCNGQATATLTYDYANRTAWLDHLEGEPNPMNHDLCTKHADGLSVPRGWRLDDRRAPDEALFRAALAS